MLILFTTFAVCLFEMTATAPLTENDVDIHDNSYVKSPKLQNTPAILSNNLRKQSTSHWSLPLIRLVRSIIVTPELDT